MRRIIRNVDLSPYRPREKRPTQELRPKPHQQRDETVGIELAHKMCSLGLGFVYEGVDRFFINWRPSKKGDPSIASFRSLGLGPRDVFFRATRPAMDDDGKLPHRACGSELEQLIFSLFRQYCFSHCSRSNIALVGALASHLYSGFGDRSDITFSTYTDPLTLATGTYQKLNGKQNGPSKPFDAMTTAGYLINVPMGEGLPNLLTIFGMSGSTALALEYLLTTRGDDILARALTTPSFTMVEIQTEPIEAYSVGYRFCKTWNMQEIAYCQLT